MRHDDTLKNPFENNEKELNNFQEHTNWWVSKINEWTFHVNLNAPLVILLSKPQPNLKTMVGVCVKMTLHHHHPPPTETQFQQDHSCYWSDVDKTLKVGSRKYLKHIPTDTVEFVLTTLVLATFVHISNIWPEREPILTKLFWSNLCGQSFIFAQTSFDLNIAWTKYSLRCISTSILHKVTDSRTHKLTLEIL